MKSDNDITNPNQAQAGISFSEICARRYSRRDLLKAGAAVGATFAVGGLAGCSDEESIDNAAIEQQANWREQNPYQSNFDFIEIDHGIDEFHHVAPDHQAQILLRWGDPLFKHAPEFDINAQTADTQLQQFGYNNDYIGYAPLAPKKGQDARALLCINHEYTLHGLMFPDFGSSRHITAEQVKISQAAGGNTIVEVNRKDGIWEVDKGSIYNRRISTLETEMEMTGPAAGHPRLRTNADRSGRKVIGTLNNCAGGMTPWGTYLTCEENINYCFGGKLPKNHPETNNYERLNIPIEAMYWHLHDSRFDLAQEPNEANRFGWVVEIDPFNPKSTPKKRTALGRFKHEGGENIIASDGRLVIYMGDDQNFEYLYKFVSRDQVNIENPKANRDLLDHGTLYVAKFFAEGYLEWLPLQLEHGPLAAHFDSQADILIEPRRAADLLGATPLDRPEDVVPNKHTGKVYVMLTNNTKRSVTDAANPRAQNMFGHIIEISELDNNHSENRGYWTILVKCGDPAIPEHNAQWNPATSNNGWFASPDNGATDPTGRLWISTDQGPKTNLSGTNDGLWALETEGSLRGTGKMFFRVPNGAEMSGPVFSDDGESLFLSVQHPGDIETKPGSTRFHNALTRWPDFEEGMPPRPSVVVVQRKGGGKVG